ncbi:MAG: NAD(P)/FAD-dependent oxidoreductase [Pseudomonadota bacterium]
MSAVDYLIVGAGAVGMAFADQLLTETTATMAIVDRRHAPGGHWNDAYPFVRLHQPSAFYGVGSRPLGRDRIDSHGWNAGYYELASGQEVVAYYDRLMRERLLASGRVRYLPMSEHLGQGRVASHVTGEVQDIAHRKLVDARWSETQIPALHMPSFAVADGVRLVPPGALPREARGRRGFVVLGGGKTAMDACVWLLEMGVDPAAIRWVRPRDLWLANRDFTQPGDAFFSRRAGGQAATLEAAAAANSPDDLFDRLERAGTLVRLDPEVRPGKFRGATISTGEVALLRQIRDVIRKGRVLEVERNRIVLEDGEVAADPHHLYVDCTANGLPQRPPAPVFDGDLITLQRLRPNLVCMSAALIAHVEAGYQGDAAKNHLCQAYTAPSSDLDWLRQTLHDLRLMGRWAEDRELRRWIAGHRLMGFGAADGGDPATAEPILARIRDARPRAEANLARLLDEADAARAA